MEMMEMLTNAKMTGLDLVLLSCETHGQEICMSIIKYMVYCSTCLFIHKSTDANDEVQNPGDDKHNSGVSQFTVCSQAV
jgi:hypothetical protein